jgi:hypothetical protein
MLVLRPRPTPDALLCITAQQRVPAASRTAPGASEVGCGSTDLWAGSPAGSWPSLRKAFTRHGLGMLTRNPEAVRQRAIAAARHRSGQPAPPATPPMDSMFVAFNHGQLPARARPPTRTRRAATPGRGDRDPQLPHRRRAQPGEPARPPLAHRHHRPARRTRPAPGRATAPGAPTAARPSVPPGPGTAAEPTTSPRSGGCSSTPLAPPPTVIEGDA